MHSAEELRKVQAAGWRIEPWGRSLSGRVTSYVVVDFEGDHRTCRETYADGITYALEMIAADEPRPTAPLVSLNRRDYGAVLTENPDGTATLKWTDYVANDWSEDFPTVAEALCSLAALEACRASDWEKSFSPDLDGATTAFLSSAVA